MKTRGFQKSDLTIYKTVIKKVPVSIKRGKNAQKCFIIFFIFTVGIWFNFRLSFIFTPKVLFSFSCEGNFNNKIIIASSKIEAKEIILFKLANSFFFHQGKKNSIIYWKRCKLFGLFWINLQCLVSLFYLKVINLLFIILTALTSC